MIDIAGVFCNLILILFSFSTSLILRIAYGYEIKGDYKDDPVVGVINTLVDIAKQSSIALTALDFLPWCSSSPFLQICLVS